MNRSQATENLKAIGIEEPTEEQITSYLNQVGGETKREKDRAEKMRADADRAAELQKQLDDLNSQNMTEIEKANKATEDANGRVAALEKELATMKTMSQLANLGIVGEDAEAFFGTDGTINFETLGKIISAREVAAASAKEKELLVNTPNPQGAGGNKVDTKPADVENAEKLVFGSKAVSNDIKDYYKL